MDRSNVVTLISKSYEMDSLNQPRAVEDKREVFCNVASVTQTEWFNGGQQGFKPEWRITMFAPDYHNEEELELNLVRYSVYRTYIRQDEMIELYVEKRTGNKVRTYEPIG